MTKSNFDRVLPLVLKHEGGYVDHPRDPGGATNLGITIATFRRYINKNGTKADLRNLTRAQAAKVYRKQYWDAIKGDDLPSGVDYAVFDFAVNSGPSRAAKYLQDVLGVRQDGKIGPETLRAARMHKPDQIVDELCDDRLAFLYRLPTYSVFGRGWSARVAGVRSQAHSMIHIDSVLHTPWTPSKVPLPPVQTKPIVVQEIGPKPSFWAGLFASLKAIFRGGK